MATFNETHHAWGQALIWRTDPTDTATIRYEKGFRARRSQMVSVWLGEIQGGKLQPHERLRNLSSSPMLSSPARSRCPGAEAARWDAKPPDTGQNRRNRCSSQRCERRLPGLIRLENGSR